MTSPHRNPARSAGPGNGQKKKRRRKRSLINQQQQHTGPGRAVVVNTAAAVPATQIETNGGRKERPLVGGSLLCVIRAGRLLAGYLCNLQKGWGARRRRNPALNWTTVQPSRRISINQPAWAGRQRSYWPSTNCPCPTQSTDGRPDQGQCTGPPGLPLYYAASSSSPRNDEVLIAGRARRTTERERLHRHRRPL